MDSESTRSNGETVYICSSTRNLDFFKVNEGEIYVDPFDKMLRSFPQLAEANLCGYSKDVRMERQKRDYNVILGFTKKTIDFLLCDSERNFYWAYDSVNRGRQKFVLWDFLRRNMQLARTVKRKTDKGIVPVIKTNDFSLVGPLVIIVDSSELSKKLRPTGNYVREHVLDIAKRLKMDVDCEMIEEYGQDRNIRRAQYRLPSSGSLDDTSKEDKLDSLVRHVQSELKPSVVR